MSLWTVCHYGRYVIMDGMPLWTVCHYGRYAIMVWSLWALPYNILCRFFLIPLITSLQMAFVCMENIHAYTVACRSVGLSDDYNFTTADLWDGSNLKQVLVVSELIYIDSSIIVFILLLLLLDKVLVNL
jgi:hypothetical protein